MEYKKFQSLYETIKEIGKSFCYNFISGDPYAGDGFSSEKNVIGKWSGRDFYKKEQKTNSQSSSNHILVKPDPALVSYLEKGLKSPKKR